MLQQRVGRGFAAAENSVGILKPCLGQRARQSLECCLRGSQLGPARLERALKVADLPTGFLELSLEKRLLGLISTLEIRPKSGLASLERRLVLLYRVANGDVASIAANVYATVFRSLVRTDHRAGLPRGDVSRVACNIDSAAVGLLSDPSYSRVFG